MSFVSVPFLIFILIVILIYFLTPKKYQWIILFIASYSFYLFSGIKTIFFLLMTTLAVFFTGVLLGRVNESYASDLLIIDPKNREQKKLLKDKAKKQKQTILLFGLLVIFGILSVLKYFNFFATNINYVFDLISINQRIPMLNLLLPLGISFYTFQSAGYIIDVYRGKILPDKNLAKFALFVSFFPQLVQGPISRYNDLAEQLFTPHHFDYTRVKFGLQLMLWGYFKKMVIADRAAVLVNTVFDNSASYEGLTIFIAAMLYCIQIYGDFSGGIDVARGVAQIFGVTLPQNFAQPLFATSIEDFWRRWHITLGSWVRDYIFYPLSLSKNFSKLGRFTRKFFGKYLGKMLPTFLAMMIAFLVVGVWHGPQWKFVFYGLYNGFFIASGILLAPFFTGLKSKYHLKTETFSWRFFQMVGTFFLVSIGRYFSRAADFMDAYTMLKQTFKTFNPWVLFDGSLYQLGLDAPNFHLLLILIAFLIIVDIFQEKGISLRKKIAEQTLIFRWGLYLAAIFSILIFGMYGVGYNAASFIYRGF